MCATFAPAFCVFFRVRCKCLLHIPLMQLCCILFPFVFDALLRIYGIAPIFTLEECVVNLGVTLFNRGNVSVSVNNATVWHLGSCWITPEDALKLAVPNLSL